MSLNYQHPYVRIGGLILAGVVAIVIVWFLIGRLFPDNPKGPTESEITSDSLRLTKPAELALLDSIDARIGRRGLVATRAESGANRAKRRADSLAIARAWEGAYVARTEEADSLRGVVTVLKADTTDLRFQLTTINKRLTSTERVNEGLVEDVAKARRCKIIGLVNCPSRIQVAALTALTVVVVQRYQSN